MKIVKHIKCVGYPVYTNSGRVSKKYLKAHIKANKAALDKHGSKIARAIKKIKLPNGEMLGSHTKRGKITVSSRVPKRLRKAIETHEKVEHMIMCKRKK